MTVTTTPLAAGIEETNREFAAFLDELSDRISKGEKLLEDGEVFEQALFDELKQAGETSRLGLSANDLARDEVPSAPPWEPLEAGAIGLLDGGLSQQNGAVYTRAGEMTYTAYAVESDAFASVIDDNQARLPWRVAFDDGIYDTFKAEIRDPGGQRLAFADGANTPWTMDAHNPLADDLTSGPTASSPDLVLATEHVFYNGDGRPVALDSVGRLSASLAADGDQIILPDGAIFDYDPWQASIESMDDPQIDTHAFATFDRLGADIVIEGEVARPHR